MAIAPDPDSVPISTNGSPIQSWDPLVMLIDKPKGLTSFDVIRRLRRVSPIRKIGHAGTLDPMATGLLICLSGRATKLMNHFMGQTKVYTGTIRLGETTASYDAETEVDVRVDASHLSDNDLSEASLEFVGDITQFTPPYSAVKVKGERLYKKARRGEVVPTPPRQVSIHRFELNKKADNDVEFEVECSSGTYIRSLAHEFGARLGVGAHLVALRRTQSGSFSADDAWQLDDLLKAGGQL